MRTDTLKNQISGQGVSEGFYDANDLATSLCATELATDLPLLVIKIERRWSGTVTISGKPRVEVPPGTLGSVLKQAGLT